jgi:hypothetical protein
MAAPDDFRKSDYLIDHYIQAAGALRDFDFLERSRDFSDARGALNKAAGRVCDALRRLANDDQPFWDTLAAMREPIRQNQPAIERMLDEIELFISQEEKILLAYKILPAEFVLRLLSDLTVTMKAFRAEPGQQYLVKLQTGIAEAAGIICGHANTPLKDPADGRLLKFSLTTKEALGVLGGAVTIVVNGVTAGATANPLPLASIVGGAASSLGFLEWLKRWKRKHD